MLWERPNKNPDKRGYLYLRKTIYVRPENSLIRNNKNLKRGNLKAQRGKYSKKVDIYCGKIVEKNLISFISFEEYLINEKKIDQKFLEFKVKIAFLELLELFISYLKFIHGISNDDWSKRQAFAIGGGYLCKETIDFVKDYKPKTLQEENLPQIRIFANRCLDAGIFDSEIIMNMYIKMFPQENMQDIQEEIEFISKQKMAKLESENFKDFLKNSQ